ELCAAADARRCFADRAKALHPELAGRRRQVLCGLRADLTREPRSAVADDENVRRALHHRPSDGDRMEITLERGHRYAAMGCSVDDRGVELDLAEHVRLPAAADARIGDIGLDDLRARFDRVESRATARENT